MNSVNTWQKKSLFIYKDDNKKPKKKKLKRFCKEL